MTLPLMQKATAVWLVENTTLTFRQIAEFCGLHELEVNGIADGEVAQGIKGFDPIANRQLTAQEIRAARPTRPTGSSSSTTPPPMARPGARARATPRSASARTGRRRSPGW